MSLMLMMVTIMMMIIMLMIIMLRKRQKTIELMTRMMMMIITIMIAFLCIRWRRERGKGDLEVKLGKWCDDNGPDWSTGLKFVLHAINTSVSTTGKPPYQLVFGQSPRSDFALMHELAQQGITSEEDIPDGVMQRLGLQQVQANAGRYQAFSFWLIISLFGWWAD